MVKAPSFATDFNLNVKCNSDIWGDIFVVLSKISVLWLLITRLLIFYSGYLVIRSLYFEKEYYQIMTSRLSRYLITLFPRVFCFTIE